MYYSNPPPPYDEESRPFLGSGNQDEFTKETVAESSLEIRMAFVRKVYTLLTCQLFGTIIMSMVYMNNTVIQRWILANTWSLIVSSLLSIVLIVLLNCFPQKKPWNYVLLTLFTITISHMVGLTVTFYDQVVVLQALLITFGVFVALTLFTLQSKWDFSGLGPFLFGGLMILVVSGFVQIFFPFSKGFQLALAIGGVIIFSGYILFDTYLIFNRYSPDDYIIASVSLYMDVINLFLRILAILSSMRSDD